FLGTSGDRAGTHAAIAPLERIGAELGGARRIFADNAVCETMVWGGDDLQAARAVAERGFSADGSDASAEREAGPHFGIDPIVGAGVHLSYALWLLGFPERASEVERRVIARAERLGRPFTLTQALGQLSVPNLACGRCDAALDLSERARAVAV